MPETVQFISKLTPEMYRHLCKQLEAVPVVSSTTTDLQAGYLLGIQRVLAVIRDGFTTPE